jgi:hypothetical protein
LDFGPDPVGFRVGIGRSSPMADEHAELVSTYTIFENDQVLLAGQLNEITNYLNEQDRLTRTRLIGAGIVWGLKVGSDGHNITVSRGCAVTTDGDLLCLDSDAKYNCCKPFDDRNAHYGPFVPQDEQIPLWELAVDEADATPIEDLDNVSNMIVVLYLESYPFDPGICTGQECDNKGKVQTQKLKVLLVSPADLTDALKDLPEARQYSSRLEDVPCERVLLDSGSVGKYTDLAAAYKAVLSGLIPRLSGILQFSYTLCETVLAEAYEGSPLDRWRQQFTDLTTRMSTDTTGIQYIYDFVQDVIRAYDEFKEAVDDEAILALRKPGPFAKHVLLGPVAAGDGGSVDPNRHRFHACRMRPAHRETLGKLRFLHRRIHVLIDSFQMPGQGSQGVKVTPNGRRGCHLGERAIPYYYRIDAQHPVHECWNYELHRRRRAALVNSYNAGLYHGAETACEPLKYCVGDHTLFRIEGHLGTKVEEAESALNDIIAQNNLPIRVISLQIDRSGSILRPLPWVRPSLDLQVLHTLYRRDMVATLDKVQGFSLAVGGIVASAVSKAAAETQEAQGEPRAARKSFAQETTEALNAGIGNMVKILKKPVSQFEADSLHAEYVSTALAAANVAKKLQEIGQTSSSTPYDTLVNEQKFPWVDWIGRIIKKREDSARELSVFGTFLKANPGMEHLAGVERGGTFILVYSGVTNSVVADFSLPYVCNETPVEEEEPVEEPKPADETEKPVELTWSGLYEFRVHQDDVIRRLDSRTAELRARFFTGDGWGSSAVEAVKLQQQENDKNLSGLRQECVELVRSKVAELGASLSTSGTPAISSNELDSMRQKVVDMGDRVDRIAVKADDVDRQIGEATTRAEAAAEKIGEMIIKVNDADRRIAAAADRLTEAEDGIGKVTTRITEADSTINGIAAKSDTADKRIDETTAKITDADKKMEGVATRIADADTRITGLTTRIGRVP